MKNTTRNINIHKILKPFKSVKFTLDAVKLLTIGLSALLFLVIMKDILQEQWLSYWSLLLIYFIPPAGKETVLPLAIAMNIDPMIMIITIIFYDVLFAILMLSNWWIIELAISKNSFINKRYTKIKERAGKIQRKHKSVNFVLFLLMITPFTGGGALTVSIIGSILQTRRLTIVLIVLTGSTLLLAIVYYVVCMLG